MIKQYDSYKPSFIDWFPEIPKHWQVVKCNHYIHLRHGYQFMNYDFTPEGIKVVKITQLKPDGTLDASEASNVDESRLNEFMDIIINEGDILMALTGGTIGKIIKVREVKEPLLQNYRVGNFFPVNDKMDKDFMFWVLSSDVILSQIFFEQRETGQPNIGKENFNSMHIALPLVSEQISIANFLDKKTSQIDALIANKKKLIELLKEERTAIINNAVTKGINPKAKLKPSGIEWLGDIPEHWQEKKLKYVVSKIGSGITPTGGASVYQKEGIPLLRSQNIYTDGLVLEDVAYISEEVDAEMSNSRIQEDDVLLNITGASIGRCFYVPIGFGRGNVNQHVCIIRPIQTKIRTKYLHFVIISDYGQTLIDVFQGGANREGLNYQQIKSFDIPLPKIAEQEVIISQIELEMNKIGTTISKIEKEIELMQEYRTALISEVVTGKIKVI